MKKLSLSTLAAQKLTPTIQVSDSVPSTPSLPRRPAPPKLPVLDMDLVGLTRKTSMPIINSGYSPSTPLDSTFSLARGVQASQVIADQACETNFYTCGPVCILHPNLFLYSAPSADQARQFDVVINVAKEIENPLETLMEPIYEKADADHPVVRDDSCRTTAAPPARLLGDPEYIHLPWQHNENFANDLPVLTALIDRKINVANERVLVHCQQGISRSASLIIAYVMKANSMDINEAYAFVKSKSPCIGPNMSLIYQLCEWGKTLAKPDLRQQRRSFDSNGAKTLDDSVRVRENRQRASSSVEKIGMERSKSENGAIPLLHGTSRSSAASRSRPPECSWDGLLSPNVQRFQDLHLES